LKLIFAGLILACSAVLAETPASLVREGSGQPILDAVVARLPREPLDITGEIVVRKRRGVVMRELKFDMALRLGAVPTLARYTIRDAFGETMEQLTVRRGADRRASIEYAAGSPPAATSPPPLHVAIQETDISWADLSLAFLWWPGSRVVGTDTVRGRDCYVLNVPAPASPGGDPEAGATGVRYTSVQLWIDSELFMLLRAEGRNADGNALRTLWVKSLKKIDEQWMIKDLEVQTYPLKHRTRLRIREVSAAAAS